MGKNWESIGPNSTESMPTEFCPFRQIDGSVLKVVARGDRRQHVGLSTVAHFTNMV